MKQWEWELAKDRTQRIANFLYKGDINKVQGCKHFFEWNDAADYYALMRLKNTIRSVFAKHCILDET